MRACVLQQGRMHLAGVPLFVINRDQDQRRLQHVEEQVSRIGLEFNRVSAVEGLNVPPRFAGQFLGRSGRAIGRLLPGEVGCYASHLICCETIVERALPYAIVVEDDVELDAALVSVVEHAIERMPRDWDILRLCSTTDAPVITVSELNETYRLVRYFKIPKKTGGQVWSLAGAKKMLKGGVAPRTRPIDVDLHYRGSFGLQTFGIYPPPIVVSGGFATTISAKDRNRLSGRIITPLLPSVRLVGAIQCVEELGLMTATRCLLSHTCHKTNLKLKQFGLRVFGHIASGN